MSAAVTLRLTRTADDLAAAAAAEVLVLLEAAISWRGDAHLALAGGRTPAALYRTLAAASFDAWPHVHIWFGDERSVPPDDTESNYRLARETLLDFVAIPAAQVHRMEGEAEPQAAGARYDEALAALARRQQRDAPALDVLLLGMGSDAHTASLFSQSRLLANAERRTPNAEEPQLDAGSEGADGRARSPSAPSAAPPATRSLSSRDSASLQPVARRLSARWAAAVFVPSLDRWRLTITPDTIRHAHAVLVLVAGADKQEALRRVLVDEGSVEEAPARLLLDIPGDVAWFVDAAALFGDP